MLKKQSRCNIYLYIYSNNLIKGIPIMNYETTLIKFLYKLDSGLYKLSKDQFFSNDVDIFVNTVNNDININSEMIKFLLRYLWENRYIAFQDGQAIVTEKAKAELLNKYESQLNSSEIKKGDLKVLYDKITA